MNAEQTTLEQTMQAPAQGGCFCAPAAAQQSPTLLEDTLNYLLHLPECESTNAYAKAHFADFGTLGAVYTTSQTAGRGRLGRSWENAVGQGFYYTIALAEPLAQPSTLPLFASLAVCTQLKALFGVACQIKWPNDILIGGKKVGGILCESISYGEQQAGRGLVCGIGINLCQTAQAFAAQNLPHATSLALACPQLSIDVPTAARRLALGLTDFGFDRALYTFAREGFAPYRETYRAACINMGKCVQFDLPSGEKGSGTVVDIDATGQLVVKTAQGETKVFTGEVSVSGIYGAV